MQIKSPHQIHEELRRRIVPYDYGLQHDVWVKYVRWWAVWLEAMYAARGVKVELPVFVFQNPVILP